MNQATIDLIKQWEGCKLKAYKDVAGIWTVGYGLTSRAGFIEVGPDTEITQAEADWYLEKVLEKFLSEIRSSITAPINENQLGAFLSLAYNIGPTAFKRSSALRHFNNGWLDRVPNAMRLWKKSNGEVIQGLINRREAEVELFLKPVEAPPSRVDRQSATQSRTVQASAVQVVSAVGGGVAAVGALDGAAQIIAIAGCFAIAGLALFIMRERLKKWADGIR